MAITNKKKFTMGFMLMSSFLVIFVLIFVPFDFFGGKNSLHWADELFNKLSKGSSYFIPVAQTEAEKYKGKEIDLTIKFKEAANAQKAITMLNAIGLQAKAETADTLDWSGDLHKLLAAVLQDADAMYNNNSKPLEEAYGFDGKEAMSLWWKILTNSVIPMQKKKLVEEANAVNLVIKKAVEPAYNFYGIEAESVKTKALTVTFLLVFYVIYTLWYGFAIYDLFNGIGLTMTKSKVKKEV